jgi:hypothetical protein
MYSSYSFTTSALDGGEWSASCPEFVFNSHLFRHFAFIMKHVNNRNIDKNMPLSNTDTTFISTEYLFRWFTVENHDHTV